MQICSKRCTIKYKAVYDVLKIILIIINTTVKYMFRKKCRNVKLFILKLFIKYYIELTTMSKINK